MTAHNGRGERWAPVPGWPPQRRAASGQPTMSVAALMLPIVLAGTGFALAVSSATAVNVNTVPRYLIGMASGAGGMLRDSGFAIATPDLSAIALGTRHQH